MAAHVRTIDTALLAALAAIDGTGGYTYDLTSAGQITCQEWSPDLPLSGNAGIWYWFQDEPESPPGEVLGYYQRSVTVQIIGVVRPSTNTAKERYLAASDLKADLQRALELDRCLGGAVDDVQLQSAAFDGAELGVSDGGLCNVALLLTWSRAAGEGV